MQFSLSQLQTLKRYLLYGSKNGGTVEYHTWEKQSRFVFILLAGFKYMATQLQKVSYLHIATVMKIIPVT